MKRHRRHQRIVRIQHRHRLLPVQSLDQLPLRQCNLFHARKKLQVRRRHARHNTHIRPRDFREPRQFPAPRHPHLQHRRLMRLVQMKQRQRQPVLVIKISFRLQDAQPRAQQCRQDLFGSGFPDAARDPRDFPAPRLAYRARKLLEPDESVGHNEALRSNRLAVSPGGRLGHHRAKGSAPERALHVIVSVMTRSVYGDEQLACTYRARINRDAGQPGHGVESCARPSTHRVSHLCNRPPHKRLKGLRLPKYHTDRSVFTVLRAPPDEW